MWNGLTMKVEPKKAWLENLRSGKYKQGSGRLVNENKHFCCMGVFCDQNNITIKSVECEPYRLVFIHPRPDASGTDEWECLPGPKWFQGYFTYDETAVPDKSSFERPPNKIDMVVHLCEHFAEMNDGIGQPYKAPMSFSEIADWIEANL